MQINVQVFFFIPVSLEHWKIYEQAAVSPQVVMTPENLSMADDNH